MPQEILLDEVHLEGALSTTDDLRGELTPTFGLSGALTVPTEVNGRTHEAFLLHDWDFRAGLNDRVQGAKAILAYSAVQLPEGIRFLTHKDSVTLDITYEYNRTYVIDFADMNRRANGDQHGRIFMPFSDMGVMYKMTGEWQIWGQDENGKRQWCPTTGLTDPNVFKNRSMKIYVATNGAITVYLDNEEFISTSLIIPKSASITIGSGAWQSFFLMTVTGFREYYGFYG